MISTAREHDEGTWAGFQLLTCFGLGRLPASGTFGSIPPVLVAALMLAVGIQPGETAYFATLSVVIVVFAGALIALGDHAEARWGKDPSPVVADEVVGVCIPLMVIPAASTQTFWGAVGMLTAAFLLFRIFDIEKSIAPPARRFERVRGPWGIMLDDVVSGLYAAACVLLIQPAGPILNGALDLITG